MSPKKPTWRSVCPQGAKCRQRTPGHLFEKAHPLDSDYQVSCEKAGVEALEVSLRVLFDWADADGSGKLTLEELQESLHIISALSSEELVITEEAWKHLDEDGNGVLNFSEFASWAGPRLGLPLGIKRMMFRSASEEAMARPCGVMNCPCEGLCGSGSHCTSCKHKATSHVSRAHSGEVPFPEYWKNQSAGRFTDLIDCGGTAVGEFQQLFDRTYKKTWTRDRTRHNSDNPKVPAGFKVLKVFRNENNGCWTEYAVRRAELLEKVHKGARAEKFEVFSDVKTVNAWREIGGAKAHRLAHECNEWYLFHGTNPKAAKSICTNDFKVSFAGDNTGTLYGRGLYFAESITKSDEYAKPNSDGSYGMLLCRILGGKVKYTKDVTPDVEELVYSVTEGPFDTVLGDREACRGTYREFVVFDTEDVYPEYLIEYRRIY